MLPIEEWEKRWVGATTDQAQRTGVSIAAGNGPDDCRLTGVAEGCIYDAEIYPVRDPGPVYGSTDPERTNEVGGTSRGIVPLRGNG